MTYISYIIGTAIALHIYFRIGQLEFKIAKLTGQLQAKNEVLAKHILSDLHSISAVDPASIHTSTLSGVVIQLPKKRGDK